MPISARRAAATGDQPPESDKLRPFTFHGVYLSSTGTHAVGDCPFCGKGGKFSVQVATGLWRCWVCGGDTERGGGNGLVFTRLVWENAAGANVGPGNGFLAAVAADRRLLRPETVAAWGVRQAADGTWLVPGFGADGKLDQVYRRVRKGDKWCLMPTPGIWGVGKVHALHMPVEDFDPARPDVVVCEGPWDGMALWEVWGMRDSTNIIAVPGCGSWRDEWTQLCRGKRVTLMFDSDNTPHPTQAGKFSHAGYDAVKRVAKRLSGVAASVRYLKWGEHGYDPARPSGWDVRDHLTQGSNEQRGGYLNDLLLKVVDAPREWFNPAAPAIVNGHAHPAGSVEALPCHEWAVCEAAWRDALRLRQDLRDAVVVVLAVCASTAQSGNQLFLDLIGSPGSAKTTICQGLLVSSNCVHLENVTKLVSGWKKPDDENKDCSFLARSNNKTWVTCEFDVLGSSPEYHQLMGKMRRIFDGETSTTYGNDDKDRIYPALRTPWIRAGTYAMMDRMADRDQSQLGDRFMRFIIGEPDNSERREIARRALQSERLAIMERVNGTAGSIVDSKTRRAQALTGGYVDWLRANVEEQLAGVDVPTEVEDFCIDLAELSADLRARPNEDKRKLDAHDSKELPTRLSRQNIRLAMCLAVVLNKKVVDADVLRVVRKVALDTAAGHSLNMVYWLCGHNPHDVDGRIYQDSGGLQAGVLEQWTGMNNERLQKYLMFLKKVGVLEWRHVHARHGSWFLTDRVLELYQRVMR